MYCVIVGDIIHSKTLEPATREDSTRVINQILEQINFKYSGRILARFGIVRGDAFEGVLYSQADAPAIIQDILKYLYTHSQIRVRISSATGDLTVVSSERNQADGEAFHIAQERIEALKKSKSSHWFQVTMYTRSVAQPLVDGLLGLISVLTQSWTAKQTQAVWAMLDCSNQQNLAAQRLGITPPAIHKHLKAASFDAYRQAWESLEKYMVDLDKDIVKPKPVEAEYTTYYSLAQQAYENGDYEDAAKNYRTALALAEDEFGENDSNLAGIYSVLGTVYLAQWDHCSLSGSRRAELLQLSRECAEAALACQTGLPRLRPEYIDAMELKGLVLAASDELEDAQTCYRQAIELAQDLYGKNQPRTLGIRINICDLLQRSGKYKEALAECQAVLSLLEPWREVYAEDYAVALQNIGECQDHLGNPSAAVDAFRKALEAFSATYPKDHPRIARIKSQLAQAEASLNHPTQKEVT